MDFIIKHWSFIREFLSFSAGLLPFLVLPRSVIFTQQNSSDVIIEKMKSAEDRYINAMAEYASKDKDNDIASLVQISILGNEYFTQLTILSDRILEGILNSKTVRNTHLPHIKDVMDKKMIEIHYQVLEKKSGIEGSFIYDPNRYKSLEEVYLNLISGEKAVDYRIKPLKYIWKKGRCVLAPISCFALVQLIIIAISNLFVV